MKVTMFFFLQILVWHNKVNVTLNNDIELRVETAHTENLNLQK